MQGRKKKKTKTKRKKRQKENKRQRKTKIKGEQLFTLNSLCLYQNADECWYI